MTIHSYLHDYMCELRKFNFPGRTPASCFADHCALPFCYIWNCWGCCWKNICFFPNREVFLRSVCIDFLNTKVMYITSLFICNIYPILFALVIFITIEKHYRSTECLFQTPLIPTWPEFSFLERRALQELQYNYRRYMQEVLETEDRQGLNMRYDTKREMGFQYRL